MTVRTTKPEKTATSRHFSEDDYALIGEGLRIARVELLASSTALEKLWPSSPMVEKLVMFAERMEDLIARIDA